MRPTSPELLEILDLTFVRHLVPGITEPYIKARASVMSQIMGHLHQRALHEGQMLWQDVIELTALLSSLEDDVPGVDVPAALQESARVIPPEAYPSIELLTARGRVLKACLVEAIAVVGEGSEAALRINIYLRRQLDRELKVCSAPALGGDVAHDLPLV